MYYSGAHLAATSIGRTLTELGTAPPAGYVDALTAADRFRDAVAKFAGTGTHDALVAAVFSALESGTDPLASKAVQRAALANQLDHLELGRLSQDHYRQLVGAAVLQYSNELLASWSAATEPDAQVLAEAAAREPFTSAADPATMSPGELTAADDHRTWMRVAESVRRLDVAASGVQAILTAHSWSPRPGQSNLILAPMNSDQLAHVTELATTEKPSSWAVARAGIVPALAGSLAGFAERAANIETALV